MHTQFVYTVYTVCIYAFFLLKLGQCYAWEIENKNKNLKENRDSNELMSTICTMLYIA
jgi:hypothetical protein